MRLSIVCIMLLISSLAFAGTTVQDDTVKAPLTETPPIIDGDPGDACWTKATWQPIDQVWIPFGDTVPADDFTGKYKIVWSESENVLYFLVETVDDAFVDHYIYPNSGYPDYDIVEVFIDENKSGGLHVFDGTGNTGRDWGTNAENAFSYHIAANAPADGEVTTECVVCDIAGTGWGDRQIPNYADHFPQFAMKKTGTNYCWEFSLIVYSDDYDKSNPAASRVQLNANKVIGLSMAYCDNDDPNEDPKTRDNFFGSVAVTAETNNDHWMNADGYGTAMLMPGNATRVNEAKSIPRSFLAIYPNPANGEANIQLSSAFRGAVEIRLFDILGREVYNDSSSKTGYEFQKRIHFRNLANGIYFLQVQSQQNRYVRKMVISNF